MCATVPAQRRVTQLRDTKRKMSPLSLNRVACQCTWEIGEGKWTLWPTNVLLVGTSVASMLSLSCKTGPFSEQMSSRSPHNGARSQYNRQTHHMNMLLNILFAVSSCVT